MQNNIFRKSFMIGISILFLVTNLILGIHGSYENLIYTKNVEETESSSISNVDLVYHLNEISGTIVSDSSGNDYEGTAINMEDSDWVLGKLNNCLDFDGVNEYVMANSAVVGDYEYNQPFSAECWVNGNIHCVGAGLVGKMQYSSAIGWILETNIDGQIAFYAANDNVAGHHLIVSSSTVLSDNQWYHVVVTLDGSGHTSGVHIYINGLNDPIIAYEDGLTGSIHTNDPLRVGVCFGSNEYFSGKIDEVVLYSKELNQNEVLYRYNNGLGREDFAENQPPNTPSKPNGPSYGWNDTLIEFLTSATDPNNDQIKYGWDWGDGTSIEWSGLLPSGSICNKRHSWENLGTYNIKVKAKDTYGALSNWSETKTINIIAQDENKPPNTPSNPNPSDNAVDVDINTNLSWTGGDPDIGDTVTYDVYFGSMPPFQKIASNTSNTSINPGTLSNSLTYFWNVVAWDNNGLLAVGPSWHFTTINITNNPPNKPSKPVGETNGKKWINYLYTSNTTDPDGDQVYYLWDWGDDSFSAWLGPYDSGAITDATHAWAEGTYNVKVKAKDINGLESNWSEPLVIKMPKSHIYNPISQLFLKFLQRFSFFEKILKQ